MSAQEDLRTNAKDETQATLELKGVCKGFGEAWEREEILKDFTLTLNPGQLTVVVGPSGCGTSTLVNLIAGFDKPDSGSITINGQPITGPGHDRMVVFQETALIPWQTTYQNVVFGPKLRRDRKNDEIEAEAHALLAKVGLAEFKDKFPIQLSGGMQRRAELARAMINHPLVMIMDEPFRGLDAMSRELMQEFVVHLFEEFGRTNVFVTSEIEVADSEELAGRAILDEDALLDYARDEGLIDDDERSLKPCTVRAIIRHSGLSFDEFMDMLDEDEV